MKYVSIDIETTGLHKNCDQILEVSAVIEDLSNPRPISELPKLCIFVDNGRIEGAPYALSLHARIFRILAQHALGLEEPPKKLDPAELEGNYHGADVYISHPDDVTDVFEAFILTHMGQNLPDNTVIKINAGGKNFTGFDKPFLEELNYAGCFEARGNDVLRISHKALDPAMLFLDPMEDTEMPGLDVCKQRAGLGDTVAHTALDDAIDVIKVTRVGLKEAGKLEKLGFEI